MATYNGHQEDANGNLLLPTPNSLVDKVELGSVASQAYTQGSFLVFNNHLCKVTKAIAKNNTLAVGTNLETISVGAQLTNFKQRIDNSMGIYVKSWAIPSTAPNSEGLFSVRMDVTRPGYTFVGIIHLQQTGNGNQWIAISMWLGETSSDGRDYVTIKGHSHFGSGTPDYRLAGYVRCLYWYTP